MRVEERYNDAIRGVLHGLPMAYGALAGLVTSLEVLNLGAGLGSLLVLAAAAGGWGIGGAIWRTLSSRSKGRVQQLAEKLGLKAGKLAEESALDAGGQEGR